MEREIAQWVHPTKDQSDDPSHHERTLLPRSYISLGDTNDVYYHSKFSILHYIYITGDMEVSQCIDAHLIPK